MEALVIGVFPVVVIMGVLFWTLREDIFPHK
jgi:hypothetical protein